MMNQNTDFIPFSKPSFNEQEEEAVCRVLKSGWLTTGKETLCFEKEFADFVHADHAIALNSGTAGLHLALESINVKPDTCVITTPYTFTASAEIIRYLGADPLFVDIHEDSYNIDPELIEQALKTHKGKISAILPVHIAGRVCDMELIMGLSEQHNVPVIEDAAHTFPAVCGGLYKNRHIGTIGKAGVFSFYANKTITTGEGGMVVTNDESIARRIKVMRLHGIDREAWDRYTSHGGSWYYDVIEAGYKYNLTDLASAIGRVQLAKAELFFKRRKEIAGEYIRRLKDFDFLRLPEETGSHSWHLFIIRIAPEKLSITRDEFIVKLNEAGIGTSVHFIPLHLMSYYKKRYGFKEDDFPIALRNFLSSISIPVYPGMTDSDVEKVIESVRRIGCAHYRKMV